MLVLLVCKLVRLIGLELERLLLVHRVVRLVLPGLVLSKRLVVVELALLARLLLIVVVMMR